MISENEPWRQVSRRALLRHAAGAAGGVLSAAGMNSLARAQAAKVAQDAAGYQDSPQNGQACADSKHFAAPASCKLVEGAISPQGWCTMFKQQDN